MTDAAYVRLDVAQPPVFAVPQLKQSNAKRTSELLQKNHEDHHIFFNDKGFHNHIVHHLLSLYAVGASDDVLQKQFEANASYQRPPVKLHDTIIKGMDDPATFKQHLGNEGYYRDYLVFFQKEIDAKGWQDVLNEYMFARDERADDMLVRMFAGLLHPIIHLGFGVEFAQPAIIAEALAQAAIHKTSLAPLLLDPERRASRSSPATTLYQMILKANSDESMANASQGSDKLREGVIETALEPYTQLTSAYHVTPETIQSQLHEMIATTAFFTFAAQKPPHIPKIDFFYIHCLNTSVFFPRFMEADWLKTEDKCRLLEWKTRFDVAIYLSRGAPDLKWDEVTDYSAKDGWETLFRRVGEQNDDGHNVKVLRALANGEKMCGDLKEPPIRKEDWLKMANLAADSFEAPGSTFVRNTGVEGAWDDIPLRESAKI